jgi:hypothetical protein
MNDPGEIEPDKIEPGEMTDPSDGGPYLLSAILCKEIVTNSAGHPIGVRGITTRAISPRPGKEGIGGPVRLELKLMLVLLAGEGRGKPYVVELQLTSPLGNSLGAGKMPIEFAAEEYATATIVVDYGMNLDEHGVYWVDVVLTQESAESGRLLTRMPLKYDFQ